MTYLSAEIARAMVFTALIFAHFADLRNGIGKRVAR